jgi:XTP/dITP diphosphohydrolase
MHKSVDLVFCSANAHKAKEMASLLPAWVKVKTMSESGILLDIPENGLSYEENALIKARFVASKVNHAVFADDSGLEVDFLSGRPGIYSARYAGMDATSEQNVDKLLLELGISTLRSARFVCVIALIINGKEEVFRGEVEGEIVHRRAGTGGFGYDPVFVPNGYDQTFSELPQDLKNTIGHRGKAVKQMVAWLEAHL